MLGTCSAGPERVACVGSIDVMVLAPVVLLVVIVTFDLLASVNVVLLCPRDFRELSVTHKRLLNLNL